MGMPDNTFIGYLRVFAEKFVGIRTCGGIVFLIRKDCGLLPREINQA